MILHQYKAPSIIFSFTLAGALVGLLEAFGAFGLDSRTSFLTFVTISLVPISLFAVCGGILGSIVAFVKYVEHFLSLPVLIFFALLGSIWIGYKYDSAEALLLLTIIIFSIWLSYRYHFRALIISILGGEISMILLRPLFSGKAMELVFSDAQTFFISAGTFIFLSWLFHLVLGRFFATHRIQHFIIGKVVLSLLLATILSWLSSVFLIRLWGFHTMEYLQVAVVTLEISLLVLPVSFLFKRSNPPSGLFLALIIPLLCCVFYFSGSAAMTRQNGEEVILKKMPHTGLTISNIGGLLDRDRDGYSSLFHFGDCDDSRSDINPAAIDWPGDKIDQNCLGGDLKNTDNKYFSLPVDVTPPQLAPSKKKVVVLLTIDTLRADAVDYSLNNTLTPTLASIASKSIKFKNAYAQGNNTLESFPFILHMAFRNLPRFHEPWSLKSQLRETHIPSSAVIQLSVPEWWNGGVHNVFLGFDKINRPDTSVRNRTSIENGKIAATEIKNLPDGSSFMFIHFEALHDYATKSMEGGRMIQQGLNLSEFFSLLNASEMAKTLKDRYLAELKDVDSAVSIIWNAIEEREKDSDVLLIICADHGEEFLDHGGFFHMGTLYEELLRVPLVVYSNTLSSREEDTRVGLYRITPTILKFLGFGGNYLKELDLTQTPTNYEIFSHFTVHERYEERHIMILDGDYKLIYDMARGQFEMYDIVKDPKETKNIFNISGFKAVSINLIQKLDTLMFFMNYGDVEAHNAKVKRGEAVQTESNANVNRGPLN